VASLHGGDAQPEKNCANRGDFVAFRLLLEKSAGSRLQDCAARADMNNVTEAFLMAGVIVGSLGAGIGLAHVALSGVFALFLAEPARAEAIAPKPQPRAK
jgi:hypothetical protein